jgi:hypothetical protein
MKSLVQRHRDIQRMRECYQKEGRLQEFENQMGAIFSNPSTNLSDFSLRHLYEALVDGGSEIIALHFNNSHGGYRMMEQEAVNTTLFANIMGQYLYNAVMRAYAMPTLIGDRLVTRFSSVERSERIPGVKAIGDQVEIVEEGKPYPRAVTGERWIDTPNTIKRGLIFFDKTGLILQECARVGEFIAINRERRILDVVLGVSTVYKRNGAAAVATYGSNNTKTSNALVDWTSVDASNQKFSAMVDPDTGEPISIVPNAVVVPPALQVTAARIQNATQTVTEYQPNAAAGTPNTNRNTATGGNSIQVPFEVLSNVYVKERTSSDTSWFHGDFQRGFVYAENWPMMVETEPGGPEAFNRDVIQRYKASERGAAGVVEPLQAVKNTA